MVAHQMALADDNSLRTRVFNSLCCVFNSDAPNPKKMRHSRWGNPMPDELMTVEEVAAMLKVKVSWVYDRVRHGILTACRM